MQNICWGDLKNRYKRQINCLDPAGYGAVTVTKSVTIDCEDTQGSILSAGTNGVTVNITAATDTKKAFKIRGISINGAGTGINGIRVLAANSVDVEEIVIDGMTQHGISLETTSGIVKVSVDKTTIRSNSGTGINSFITGGTMLLDVSNSRLTGNATGLSLSSNTKANISDSVASANTTGSVAASSSLGVIRCNISNNTIGISSLGGGSIRFANTLVTGNGNGLSASGGGTLVSFISNVFSGNTVDGVPTSTTALQ